jgi:hypothetical protein
MKFPSFSYLFNNAKTTFLRFPLMMVSAIIAVSVGIYTIECREETKNFFPYLNIILSAGIGIPLFFSAAVLSAKYKNNGRIKLVSNFLVVFFLLFIFLSFPHEESTLNINQPYIKFVLYIVGAHLLVSFSPFMLNQQLNGFWQFNRILFQRIIIAGIFSGALFLGLSLAVVAVNELFEIKIHEELYFEMLIIIGGIFNTLFFANGIPENLDELEQKNEYPKALKVFAQYILLPLLSLYLIILYIYGGKIIIQSNWPKGMVSYLIVCISTIGILTFLLLHPFAQNKESNWMVKAEKLFYLLMLPLIVMLFIAIFMRIDDYGITINRYFILALGIWLSIVAVFSLFFKSNIKFIPISLAAIILLSSFGPWGVFSVSEHYQINRLKQLLEKNKILVNGKIVNETKWTKDSTTSFKNTQPFLNDNKLNDSLKTEVKSMLDYLDEYHGFSEINDWFKQDIGQLINNEIKSAKNKSSFNEASIYMKSMGLDYEQASGYGDNKIAYYNVKENEQPLKIDGYDYELNFNKNIYSNSFSNLVEFKSDSTNCSLTLNNEKELYLLLQFNNDSLNLSLNSLVQQLKSQYGENGNSNLPESAMTIRTENSKLRLKVMIQSLDVESNNNKFNLNALSGKLLIDVK